MDDYPYGNLTLTSATTVMALNIYYMPEFIKWKMQSEFRLFNAWPNGAGIFNCHLAYWPPQLNVKVLPDWFKAEVRQKYEEELYPWLEENWNLGTGIKKKKLRGYLNVVDYDTWRNSEYGINRLEGLLTFMEAEDWSERLPETAEWCYKVAKERFLDFNEVFPDLDWLEWYK
jgi:hypothetical protein